MAMTLFFLSTLEVFYSVNLPTDFVNAHKSWHTVHSRMISRLSKALWLFCPIIITASVLHLSLRKSSRWWKVLYRLQQCLIKMLKENNTQKSLKARKKTKIVFVKMRRITGRTSHAPTRDYVCQILKLFILVSCLSIAKVWPGI